MKWVILGWLYYEFSGSSPPPSHTPPSHTPLTHTPLTHTPHTEMTAKLSEHSQHVAETSCKLLWGSKLSSLPFTSGDNPINFSSLWPDKRHFVEVYKEANLEQECYSLCALLVVTNGTKCLAALLEDGALHVNHCFGVGYGKVTLAHLACALGSGDIVQVLLNQNASRNGIWASKDDEGM